MADANTIGTGGPPTPVAPLPPPDLGGSLYAYAATPMGVDIDKLAQGFSNATAANPQQNASQLFSQLAQRLTPVEQGTLLRELDGMGTAGAASGPGGGAFTPQVKLAVPVPNLPKPAPIPAPTTMADQQDKAVNDWLSGLGGAVSDGDKKSLAQIGNDATTLKAWFDAHKRGDPALNDMPQNVADAQKRLLANDAVARRIEPQSGNDKGVITRDSLGGFLGDLDKAASNAKGSWDSFKKDNPNADPVALRSAADASILQANLPVLDAAGSSAAKVDNLFNLDDVKAVANAGNSLPAPLVAAASHFSNAGEFQKLDIAGDNDPSKAPDGLAANNNIDYYLSKATPKTSDDTTTDLKTSAIEQAVKDAGGDASKVNGDYFKDPSTSKASGADKAAAMIQLSETVARYENGEKAYVRDTGPDVLSSPQQYHDNYGDGPTPGEERDAFIKDIKGKIGTLEQDKDVQSFMTDQMPKALQAMVGNDPGLKDAFQKAYDNSSGSKALTDAFNAKDSKGNPVSTTAALSNFLQNPNVYALGLGSKPDYTGALSGASQDIKDKVTQGYGDIVSGKEFDDLTKSGTPADQALLQSAFDKTAYDSVLDKDTVQKGTETFNDTVAAKARDDLTKNLSGDDMLKGLGVSGPDDPKLEQLITDNIGSITNPADQIKPQDVLSAVRQVNDALRGGVKFDDAMAKVSVGWKAETGPQADAYKAGVMHGASAVLLAGAMGARLGTQGGNSNPLQTAQQTLGTAGLLTEGGAKYVQSNLSAYKDIGKNVENVGKLLGGVAGNALGFVGGVIGAVQSAKSGDFGGAAAQGIFAGLNGVSVVATAGEIANFAATQLAAGLPEFSEAAEPVFAAAGGVFGAIGGAVGGVAAVGGLLYGIISGIIADNKLAASEQDWYQQLQQGFAPAGTTLPELGTLISAPNGYVPAGPLPAANY